jgi:adenylate kinase
LRFIVRIIFSFLQLRVLNQFRVVDKMDGVPAYLSAETIGYMEAHDIKPLFERLLKDLVVHKPADPISFLIKRLRSPQGPKIVIAGPPAAGKGTQCELIAAKFGVVHISTGDLLRDAVAKKTELGLKAQSYMTQGNLVPDELVVDLVIQRLAQPDCAAQGWLLDGFPRTRAQALALQSAGILPDKFVLLKIDDKKVVSRVSGRRTDPVTGKVYHIEANPATDPQVIARLVQRADDTEATMMQRLEVYHRNVAQVVECYRPIVRSFDADQPKEKLFEEISAYVSKPTKPLHSEGRKVMISGAPASGKGTQCERIVAEFNLVHISTGDLLRDHVKRGTELGRTAKQYMDSGKLVPDSIIIDIVQDRLSQTDCRNLGWLLDGFPRTRAQALALGAMGVQPDKFIALDVPDHLLVERVTGRRTDPATGKIYHMKFNPPTDTDVAKRLVQRADDNEETVRTRLSEFHRNSSEVLQAYDGLVRHFDGTKKPDDVFAEIRNYIAH